MLENKLDLLQERNFGELFDVTMSFIKQNFKLYLKTVLTYAFPIMILAGFGIAYFMQSFNIFEIEHDPTILDNPESFLFSAGIALIAGLIYMIAFIMIMAIGSTYVHTYVHNDNISLLTSAEIWSKTKGNLGWIMGYALGLGLIVFGLYMLIIGVCVLGGMLSGYLLVVLIPVSIIVLFYCLITFMYVIPIKLEEPQLGFFDTLKKCFDIIKNRWWKSFGFIMVFNMLLSAVSYVFIIPMYGLVFSAGLFGQNAILSFVSGLGISIFYSFALLATSFIYIAISIIFYSLYEEKYGLNLLEQIDSIGSGTGFDNIESI